ncbi:MAG: hypothetical protein RBR02_09750 [Desulfuromonadaceae bacterium]|nr:hypothetical protein [Desulfuromonadaceae bacterium]
MQQRMQQQKSKGSNLMCTAGAVFFIIVLLLLANVSTTWAGAWTMPAGKLYTRMAYSEYAAQRYFYEDGSTKAYAPRDGKQRDFDYDEQTWSFYAEYGLFDNITLIGSFDYKETEWTFQSGGRNGFVAADKTARSSGLADINFGLRYRFVAMDSGALSLQALYKSAEAYDHKDENLSTDIRLGDAQDDFEIRLQFGHSLYPYMPGYFNVEAGYRWRSKYMADEFVYLLEAGVDVTKSLYIRTKLDGTANVGNGDDPLANETKANANEIDLGKLEITAGYKLTSSFALEASYFNELYGASTTKGEAWSVALAAILF